MNLDQINDVPDIVMEFLEYHSTVRGHSDRTVAGYYLDLKILFRYLKRRRHLVPKETPFQEIDITDIDLDFIKSIRIEELYRYQSFSPIRPLPEHSSVVVRLEDEHVRALHRRPHLVRQILLQLSDTQAASAGSQCLSRT